MLCVVDIFNVQMWGVGGVKLEYTALLVGEGGIDMIDCADVGWC